MAKFKLTKTGIEGVVIIEPAVFGDQRGFFMETYNAREFAELGVSAVFVQDNHSMSMKNVLRGLHFQTARPQDKLVRVISGEVYDVAVDLRRDSKTFGKWTGALLSGENKKQFFVPKGFAHGFAVLSEKAEFVYKCTDYYDPAGESGIIWNDAELAIDWGKYIDTDKAVLSEKDKKLPTFKEFRQKL